MASGFSWSAIAQSVSSSSGTSLDRFIGLLGARAKALERHQRNARRFSCIHVGAQTPARERTIYEYIRRDVPDSFQFPRALFDFFLQQVDKYGAASDATLQQLRYLREGVFLKSWSREEAAREALKKRSALGSGPVEDLAAFRDFAQDMRADSPR
jgi:hypothetical protein